MIQKSILYDSTKCIGCKACQVACKQWNRLPAAKPTSDKLNDKGSVYDQPLDVDAGTWLIIDSAEIETGGNVNWSFFRRACMHCSDAACMTVCPVAAIWRSAHGFIVIDENKCIGCRLCDYHCPFQVPKFDPQIKISRKCWLCQDRLSLELKPACVSVCPAGALDFGERLEMIITAKKRMLRMSPQAKLYGVTEFGGLGVISIILNTIPEPVLPASAELSLSTRFWRRIVRPFGIIALSGTALTIAMTIVANWAKTGNGNDND